MLRCTCCARCVCNHSVVHSCYYVGDAEDTLPTVSFSLSENGPPLSIPLHLLLQPDQRGRRLLLHRDMPSRPGQGHPSISFGAAVLRSLLVIFDFSLLSEPRLALASKHQPTAGGCNARAECIGQQTLCAPNQTDPSHACMTAAQLIHSACWPLRTRTARHGTA